jgi:putative endonuclease
MVRLLSYSVYILSNHARTVFYVGVTSNLESRVCEHKQGVGSTFTAKYKCHYLMYWEDFNHIDIAIAREKQLKKWLRKWKIELIRQNNPEMSDLADSWYS